MNVGLLSRLPVGAALRPLYTRTLASVSSPAAADPTAIDPAADTRPLIRDNYRILAGTVVSRPPFLTPELTEFEASYYFYQRRLDKRLALPFTRYFYFTKKSPADLEWKRKQKAAAAYTGFGPQGWADELLVGDDKHKEEDFGYRRLVDTTVTGEDQAPEEGVEETEEQLAKKLVLPVGRQTKADIEGDLRSLDRAGSRTLYLLVKDAKLGKWRFPASQLLGRESLRKAAGRTLAQAAGVNMNIWFVGNVPIGHWVYKHHRSYVGTDLNEKTFFMKARIMAGQADLKNNMLGLEDFMWLAKDEIPKFVTPQYMTAIEDMLVAR